MSETIENKIIKFLRIDLRREYTIPEIIKGIGVSNREKVASSLARLEGQKVVEISKEKGKIKKTPFYRLRLKE